MLELIKFMCSHCSSSSLQLLTFVTDRVSERDWNAPYCYRWICFTHPCRTLDGVNKATSHKLWHTSLVLWAFVTFRRCPVSVIALTKHLTCMFATLLRLYENLIQFFWYSFLHMVTLGNAPETALMPLVGARSHPVPLKWEKECLIFCCVVNSESTRIASNRQCNE